MVIPEHSETREESNRRFQSTLSHALVFVDMPAEARSLLNDEATSRELSGSGALLSELKTTDHPDPDDILECRSKLLDPDSAVVQFPYEWSMADGAIAELALAESTPPFRVCLTTDGDSSLESVALAVTELMKQQGVEFNRPASEHCLVDEICAEVEHFSSIAGTKDLQVTLQLRELPNIQALQQDFAAADQTPALTRDELTARISQTLGSMGNADYVFTQSDTPLTLHRVLFGQELLISSTPEAQLDPTLSAQLENLVHMQTDLLQTLVAHTLAHDYDAFNDSFQDFISALCQSQQECLETGLVTQTDHFSTNLIGVSRIKRKESSTPGPLIATAQKLPSNWEESFEGDAVRRLFRQLELTVTPLNQSTHALQERLSSPAVSDSPAEWGELDGFFDALEERYFPKPSFKGTLTDFAHDFLGTFREYVPGTLHTALARREMGRIAYQFRTGQIDLCSDADLEESGGDVTSDDSDFDLAVG